MHEFYKRNNQLCPWSYIFQSQTTSKHPTVTEYYEKVSNYNNFIPELDKDITMDELELALNWGSSFSNS